MDWINGHPYVFILLQNLQNILDRGTKLSFLDRILIIMEHLSTWKV